MDRLVDDRTEIKAGGHVPSGDSNPAIVRGVNAKQMWSRARHTVIGPRLVHEGCGSPGPRMTPTRKNQSKYEFYGGHNDPANLEVIPHQRADRRRFRSLATSTSVVTAPATVSSAQMAGAPSKMITAPTASAASATTMAPCTTRRSAATSAGPSCV